MPAQAQFSGPSLLLRAEAAATLLLSLYAYATYQPGHWLFYALLFFFPDISLLPFALGAGRLQAAFYNALHTELAPLALLAVSLHAGSPWPLRLGLLWLGHIAFDRLLGAGLKYPGIFRPTHIQATSVPPRDAAPPRVH